MPQLTLIFKYLRYFFLSVETFPFLAAALGLNPEEKLFKSLKMKSGLPKCQDFFYQKHCTDCSEIVLDFTDFQDFYFFYFDSYESNFCMTI